LNRLDHTLASLQHNKSKALVAYLVAGDPDLKTTIELMHGFVDAGVDIIELGIPFSDPIAEGVTIQDAHDRALKKGSTFLKALQLLKEFRSTDNDTPIILMGYSNTFMANHKVLESPQAKNIDGLIIVDLPGEISHKDLGINNDQLHSITLMSPTTNAIRKKAICRNASGFIYYINVRGVTGHSTLNFKEMARNIKEIRKSSNLPIFSGFGIKTKEDVLKASASADGVVIGSHLVQMIEACSHQNNYKKIYNYLRAIAKAIK
jgi:tryptophan synthase alpha chain